ncbi:DUF4412 domain-containing protein [Acetobacter sp. AN02]|uniref:hypothetical protein n=1 Tax=Acetobacter sp. AN02 TaxID=2894186 RepID=UPI00243444B9|nr:hypothetical protein [Acetobacter sp. AN02]MDG6094979.1 DUF4412 domain-containing protein [Acetobacter sp. AN02]
MIINGRHHLLRVSAVCLTLAGGMSVIPSASAEGDHPPLMPEKDAVITYQVQSEGTPGPQTAKLWFTAQGAKLRIDSGDGKGSTILDRATGDVTLVMNQQRVWLRLSGRQGVRNPFMLDPSMSFTRGKTSSEAGIPCTEWAIHSPRGDAEACITSDGLILRQKGVDGDGAKGELKAENVTYGTLPDSDFQPPAGYQEVRPHRAPPAGGTTAPVMPADPAITAPATPAPSQSTTGQTAGPPATTGSGQ